jgi:hypothetical protein
MLAMSEHSDFGALPITNLKVFDGKTLGRTANGLVVLMQETMVAGRLRNRRLSLLGKWLVKGLISASEVNAADQFNQDYNLVFGGENYSSSSMIYVDGGGESDGVSLGHLKVRAKRRLVVAGDAVGPDALAIITAVIGSEMPLSRCGMPRDRAKRVLLLALPKLAVAYGG